MEATSPRGSFCYISEEATQESLQARARKERALCFSCFHSATVPQRMSTTCTCGVLQ